jgi:beta-galactosidase
VRSIRILPRNGVTLTPECPSLTFDTCFLPENAARQPVTFRVLNAAGIESPCATVEQQGGTVTVTGKFDGEVYLRAVCCNGYSHARVISQLKLTVEGMGASVLDPYRFVAGGLYDLSYGELGAGNEHGVSFARDGESMAGFSHVDFGLAGSDEITLPIFALSGDAYVIELWLGDPHNGGEKLTDLPYCKPSIWNVYQPETYKLPRRLTGMQDLCFVLHNKVHLGGFCFTRQSRAWQQLSALEADALYGDSFVKTEEGVTGIGNNVSFRYEEMDFEGCSEAVLVIDGATPLAENPITLRMQTSDGGERTEMVVFRGGKGRCEQRFAVSVPGGVCSLTFVFLPGSCFDFYSFRFERR